MWSVGRFRHNAFKGVKPRTPEDRERERTKSARYRERERPKSANDLSERTERVLGVKVIGNV